MHHLEPVFETCIKHEASDIHVTVGKPVTYRINASLRSFDHKPLTPDETTAFVKSLLTDAQFHEYQENLNLELGYSYKNNYRFRVSVFKQKSFDGLVMRMIPNRIRSMDEIGIPSVMKSLLDKDHGLILVTGPTGAGKSTSLASMIEHINETDTRHIITIEEPIEYIHEHKKCIINQREVGPDTVSFAKGLVHALRQDPDVIMVGEIRDFATIETALIATETGHLVFSTLNTFGAVRTVDRIVDVFPVQQQNQIRLQLSMNLLAVISQQLVPRVDQEGLIATFEIMIATPAIQNLIREGRTFMIPNEMQTGARIGMCIFEQEIGKLIQKGVISNEYAGVYAH